MNRDNLNNHIENQEILIAAATGGNTVTGQSIDGKGMEAVHFALSAFDASDSYSAYEQNATDELRFVIEESDDGSSWNEIDTDRYLPTRKDWSTAAKRLVEGASEGAQRIGCLTDKRYVRIKITSTTLNG